MLSEYTKMFLTLGGTFLVTAALAWLNLRSTGPKPSKTAREREATAAIALAAARKDVS